MYSACSRFYTNQFTFGGIIAEQVNTAKTRCKVNPTYLSQNWITYYMWDGLFVLKLEQTDRQTEYNI